jgi:hypothetical protein
MTNGRAPHRRQSLVNWVKSRLRRPSTLQWAFAILRVVDLVARFLDWTR